MRRRGDRTRRVIDAAALAVLIAGGLVGCTVSAGDGVPQSGGATTTTRPPPADPGDRLDGAGLPKPVSNLVAFDGLVAYYSSGRGQQLELVAVDPAIGQVAWTHRSAMPYQSPGVAIWLDAADVGIPVLTHLAGTDGTFYLKLLDRTGTARWSRSIDAPLTMPETCQDRICVDTASGPESVGAISGRRYPGGTPPSVDASVIGSSGDRTIGALAADPDDGTEPSEGLMGVPRLTAGKAWTRPLDELYGDDAVTLRNGWTAQRYGDDWVTWLGAVTDYEGDRPEFPYTEPVGSVAGFASDDGAPLWNRSGTRLCYEFSTDAVAVLCRPKTVFPAEGEQGTGTVSSVVEIDPHTGKDRYTVTFDEPLDLFDLGARSLRLGPDQYLFADGPAYRGVDFAARSEAKGSARTVGWCPAQVEVDEVLDAAGEAVSFGSVTAGSPCVLGDGELPEEELLAPIADRTLPAVDEVSVVDAGIWTVWIADGQLAGVARER